MTANMETPIGRNEHPEPRAKPLNVLLIHSDQHSRKVLGAYGNEIVRTPNLDALARDGTLFNNAYCNSPICVPSRASEATGRYVHDLETWDNAHPYIGSSQGYSWGHRLSEQGHTVTTIGKLHFRRSEDPTGFADQRLAMHVAGGVGDQYQWLRADRPVRVADREAVSSAGPGKSEYTRYDTAISDEACRWLREEAGESSKPWALMVSFVHPHLPLTVPSRYYQLYDAIDLPMPTEAMSDDWPDHPVLNIRRRLGALDRPFNEPTIRRATAAYYGMVTFLDDQIGKVLEALTASGHLDDTAIIYTSDHGEMLGNHGLWWKNSMYEESAGVPLIVNSPRSDVGKIVKTNVSLVDIFPTMIDAVGAEPSPDDADLPGTSLFKIADGADPDRVAFSEYHAAFSPKAFYMLRVGSLKYVHYVGEQAQLFDLERDPDEVCNLADLAPYRVVMADCERQLRTILDPARVDSRARGDQQSMMEAAGGREAVLATGAGFYSPPPEPAAP